MHFIAPLAVELGEAYLGTQGDVWDAQKDAGLAALGGALGVALVLLARSARRSRAGG